MERGEDDQRDWLSCQLVETQRLIDKLRKQPESPKRQLALEQLARVQLRLLQFLSGYEPPNPN
jgi:hypothetical protein